MNQPLNCRTIPAEKPFINRLAAWILEQYGANEAVLTKTLVLLPNRRACRALREAFLEITGGKPLLLPRIQPLGDVEEGIAATHFAPAADIPPPISPLRRELLLTRLVMGFSIQYNIEQAAELARQLAQFIDDVAREGLNFFNLKTLVPEELAAHWQQTLDFLTLVSLHWPRILESEGALDPVEHRNRLLKATAKAWREHPPAYPVIAAGSTGSQPATAALLATIARLPQGTVILPGLDIVMPQAEWDMVAETHPQFGMKQLLEGMGCKREDVKYQSANGKETNLHFDICPLTSVSRVTAFRFVLAPPEATAHWPQAKLPLTKGLAGVRLLAADTLLDEARLIAVALRETLETPEKTAALVTPDRNLARMVAAQMQRFGVTIDDSAGRPLMDTPPGYFLRLAADMAASGAAPAPLLALLRHPWLRQGGNRRNAAGYPAFWKCSYCAAYAESSGLSALIAAAQDKELKQWLSDFAEHAQEFCTYFKNPHIPLEGILKAHMQFAEWLASADEINGAERLWAGEAGNQLAAFLAELLQLSELLPQIDPISYPRFFETLLAGQTYRPSYGLHPRLHILSPMEARLLHFDRIILGSLNEGTWPQLAEADPWMSRPMRKAFGLPAPERDIGQSAHDFYLLAAAPEVILSRARKVEGTPTVPSRWLVRLETLVGGLDKPYLNSMRCDAHYERGKKLLDAPAVMKPLERPSPIPPLEARPRQLRVTAIDNWLRDPYMIYAQYILKLRKLEPLDREPNAADFGSLVHKALERFTRDWPQALPDNDHALLLECGRAAFADFIDRPAVACLWWPRFEAMTGWLLDIEKQRRLLLARVLGELKGKWQFDVDGKAFTLTTRIDRMEIGNDNAATLIDYKTGTIPAQADISRGLANQLPLEALIAMHGTLDIYPVGVSSIHRLEYWKLAGNPDDCEIKSVNIEEIAQAKERLETLIRRFDDAATPYAAPSDPSLAARFNDYEHLTRRKEWEAV